VWDTGSTSTRRWRIRSPLWRGCWVNDADADADADANADANADEDVETKGVERERENGEG
jgi:hypothetical protein